MGLLSDLAYTGQSNLTAGLAWMGMPSISFGQLGLPHSKLA